MRFSTRWLRATIFLVAVIFLLAGGIVLQTRPSRHFAKILSGDEDVKLHAFWTQSAGRTVICRDPVVLAYLQDALANSEKSSPPFLDQIGVSDITFKTGKYTQYTVRCLIFRRHLGMYVRFEPNPWDLPNRSVSFQHPIPENFSTILSFLDGGYTEEPLVLVCDEEGIVTLSGKELQRP